MTGRPPGPQPELRAVYQHICTECGTPYTSRNPHSKVHSDACRMRRNRRKRREGGAFTDFAIDAGPTADAMQEAAKHAIADLPQVARDVLAGELRPVVREHLTQAVLDSIGSMVDLLPLVHAALADDLVAVRTLRTHDGDIIYGDDGEPIYEVDYDRRSRAVQIVLKNTVQHGGVAPQAEKPEMAPLTIHFDGMQAPLSVGAVTVDGAAYEAVVDLPAGARQCDSCGEIKPDDEFVGASDRCEACHAGARDRIQAAIEARTGNGAR